MHDNPSQRDVSVTGQMLTRTQVAERLGVSVSAVRRMEGKTLHPVQDGSGRWRFASKELGDASAAKPKRRSLKRSDAGEMAARVFQALAEGRGLRYIVTRLRVDPAKVRELYSEWQLDLASGERKRREQAQLVSAAKDERRQMEWMRALGGET
jgi:hypothetical protein